VNPRLCRCVLERLNHVPQHRDAIAPRVFKVDGRMALLGDDQSKALIKPPATHTDSQTYIAIYADESRPRNASFQIPYNMNASTPMCPCLIRAIACLLAAPWVQLSFSAGNGWYHWLMPISCHFRDCKVLLVTSLTHVSGAIASSVQTCPVNFHLYKLLAMNDILYHNTFPRTFRVFTGNFSYSCFSESS